MKESVKHPADSTDKAPGRESALPSWIKRRSALDGAASVFGLSLLDDSLTMIDAEDLVPYEVVAADAWQRVGDSMRAALSTR